MNSITETAIRNQLAKIEGNLTYLAELNEADIAGYQEVASSTLLALNSIAQIKELMAND